MSPGASKGQESYFFRLLASLWPAARTIGQGPSGFVLGRAVTDEQLVCSLRAGDKQSLGTLIERWQRPLYRFVYRMLPRHEDASDICQETFLRVYDKADRFDEGSRFSTWMYQIALNLCRDQLRRKKRWNLILAQPSDREDAVEVGERVASDDDDPAQTAAINEQTAALERAMGEIPKDQREVLILKEYQGLKFKEIAQILDCPESTVKSRMYYGLKGLRQVLEREGIDGFPTA